jgi:hypothetical protein
MQVHGVPVTIVEMSRKGWVSLMYPILPVIGGRQTTSEAI